MERGLMRGWMENEGQDEQSYILLINFITMSTRTNLNHYRKLSNTIQLKSRYSTLDQPRLSETVKLPALNAITKSIKYNDLSFATNRDLFKLRKQPEVAEDYTEVAAHNILLNSRKKYDNISKTREVKERQIEELQTEREKFTIQRTQYVDVKNNAEKKVKKLEEDLQNIKNLGEEGEMEKKLMINMSTRLKSDKIVYDQRKYDLEKEYKSIDRTRGLILKESTSNHEEQDKTRKVYSKLSEHFDAEERERNLHIASLQRMIEQKNNLVEYTTLRGAEMKEISQNALQDKDQKEKNWYKVYLCHRFVEKLLRDKMNREMLKFGTVQHAFKTIKTETGVTDVQNLVSKFLNKEHIYGDLLGKIAGDEKDISDLKTMNEALTRQRNILKSDSVVLNSNKKDHTDLTQEQKQMLNISQKATVCQLFYEKIKIWLLKNKKKFYKINDKRKQVIASDTESSGYIIESFKQYLTNLSASVAEAKEVSAEQLTINDTVKNKVNLRIKVGEQTEQDKKKNETKQRDEEEFVYQQREDLHKDNEKFMKQLKKKYEEVRKTKIDSQPKKKEASPQKPKHVEAN